MARAGGQSAPLATDIPAVLPPFNERPALAGDRKVIGRGP
jgi:hypothetical protein